MAYVPPLNGGRINASIGGNTAGVSTLISTGTMALVGGNNVTLSQNGNSISINAAGAAGASINFSAGTASGNLASVTFANSGNVSFGLSNSAITGSYSQTNQTLGLNVAGNTTVSSGSIARDARSLSFSGMGAVSVGLSGSMVQISAPVQSAVTNGIQSLVVSGNTTGTAASISSGQMTLAGGNNVTLSQNGNAVTVSGAPMFRAGAVNTAAGGSTSGTMGSAYTGGMALYAGSNIGISQSTDANSNASVTIQAAGGGGGIALVNGTATYSSGSVNLNASGALTINNTGAASLNFSVPATSHLAATGAVSISTNGLTINIGAPVFHAGISGTNTLGNSAAVSNGLQLVGGNNITLSQATDTNGATVTISGNAGGGGAGGGVAISGGGALYSSGTMNLNASGALTIASTTGTALNLSVPATSSLVGVNGITVTSAGNTISISGGGGGNGTVSNWEPIQLQAAQLASLSMNATNLNTLYMHKLQPMGNVSASVLMELVNVNMSTSSNATYSGGFSAYAGIYSATGGSLSLITQSSGSYGYSWSVSSTNGSANMIGLRAINIPMTVNMSPGNYWVGLMSRTTFATFQSVFLSHVYGISNSTLTYAGNLGQAAAVTQGIQEGVGLYSNSVSVLPNVVPMASIVQSNLKSYFMPYMAFKNTTW